MGYFYILMALSLPSIWKILKALFFKLIFKEMKFKDLIEYEKQSKKSYFSTFSKKNINDS